ncbi:MAG: hypothetical protein R3E12_11370 [Candidatus Eisenbacteria bacterium]|uniref:DUF4129 domain-containing protein n=1 Tax=Eiseniibacteriota bacterium TaxID=2212470 RepID=A0A956RQ48_UNCEI|nr:DUF4129 domain-containing protein [Candidatus Eisenbacteria bacterium]
MPTAAAQSTTTPVAGSTATPTADSAASATVDAAIPDSTTTAADSTAAAEPWNESTLRSLLESGKFQTELPNEKAGASEDPRNPWTYSGPWAWNGSIVGLMLAGLAAILLIFVLLHFFREASERRLVAEGRVGAQETEPPLDISIPLGDIDALAGRGDFAAAVRELLHRVFQSLAGHRGLVLSRALTSREIIHVLDLPRDGRAALSELAGTVEHSLFGTAEVREPEFRRCRELYAQLEQTLRSRRLPRGGAE